MSTGGEEQGHSEADAHDRCCKERQRVLCIGDELSLLRRSEADE